MTGITTAFSELVKGKEPEPPVVFDWVGAFLSTMLVGQGTVACHY